MVWAGVTSTGLKTPLIFIEADVKINQHAFLKMIKSKVVPWVKKVTGNKGITLQQDGATSHTPKLVQDWSDRQTDRQTDRLTYLITKIKKIKKNKSNNFNK